MICQEEFEMITGLDEMQKFGKDNMDTAMKSMGAVSKTMQAIATEMTDYSKKSFEDGTAALEKLMGAKTIEKAIEVQSEFFKSAYEGFVSEATKISDMYSDLAKETYKPIEGLMAKAKNGM
jgi:phasin family protein